MTTTTTLAHRARVKRIVLARLAIQPLLVSVHPSVAAKTSSPQGFGSYIAAAITRWKKVAQDAGITPE
ncbi:MAG: hypothetical protein JSS04_14090 [Proteobacteria bacterium]|nr:hypothetical protein [Pseudomonadota bacterium]